MTKWQDITTAPRGSRQQVGDGKTQRDVFVAVPVWALRESDGHVTKSQWEPSREAWSAFTTDAGPTHWQPYRSAQVLLAELTRLHTALTTIGVFPLTDETTMDCYCMRECARDALKGDAA